MKSFLERDVLYYDVKNTLYNLISNDKRRKINLFYDLERFRFISIDNPIL